MKYLTEPDDETDQYLFALLNAWHWQYISRDTFLYLLTDYQKTYFLEMILYCEFKLEEDLCKIPRN